MNMAKAAQRYDDLENATIQTMLGIRVTRTVRRIALGMLDEPMSHAFAAYPIADFYDVICHGALSGHEILPLVNGKRARISAALLARLIWAQPDYRGQPIRLISCWTARASDGFAAQLAAILRADVLGCTGLLESHPFGQLLLADGATWQLFSGDERQLLPNPA